MRTPLVIALLVGCTFALDPTASAQSKSKRSAQPQYYYVPPSSTLKDQTACGERADNADPAGSYAGYPCWARETFSRAPR
jgi:hypothetical protein